MQEVELISGVAVIALYVALIALVIFLIITLKRIVGAIDKMNRAIDGIEEKVDNITAKAGPLIDNSIVISADIKDISANLKLQSERVTGIVDSVKDTTDSIIEFEQKVQKDVEGNVFDALNMVSAVTKGVKTFISAFSGSHSHNGSVKKSKSRSKSSYESEEDQY